MKELTAIIVILLPYVSCERTPTISYISQEQIKDIGGTVLLTCAVQYAQDYPVLWMRVDHSQQGESLPLSNGSSLITQDSRFSLRDEEDVSTYTLQIMDIQVIDAGYYQCQVPISPNNIVSAVVALEVRRPPVISDNSTRSLLVNEGQSVKLECYAAGYPPPRISWHRENNAILPTGGSIYRGNTLEITKVHKEDRGTYYCVAENGVGKGVRRNVALEIEFAPVITVPESRITQALQNDVDLECYIEAYPPPVIVWRKDDVQLTNNQHYSISHLAKTDAFTETKVHIINIENQQYGIYICRAVNKLGSSEAEVELSEPIIPVCQPACNNTQDSNATTSPPASR